MILLSIEKIEWIIDVFMKEISNSDEEFDKNTQWRGGWRYDDGGQLENNNEQTCRDEWTIVIINTQ